MESARHAGRWIGAFILAQILGSATVNSFLEKPLFEAPGFLEGAAPHSGQLGIAVFVALVTEALWVAVAVTAFPLVVRRARAKALGLLVLAAVILALAVVENVGVMSMVSVSQAYTKAPSSGREELQTVRTIVASSRNWAHLLARIFDGVLIFFFYAALHQAELIPRVLARAGLVAAPLMILGLVMPFFGHEVVFPLLAPIGLAQLLLAGWLLARGLREPAPNEASGPGAADRPS